MEDKEDLEGLREREDTVEKKIFRLEWPWETSKSERQEKALFPLFFKG